MKTLKPTVLIVDDDPNDLLFVQLAFKAVNSTAKIQVVSGGAEGIAYLDGRGIYSDRVQYGYPHFVITDLKMPGVDGFGVLAYLKQTEHSTSVRAVVFSGSTDEDDIKKSYSLGAASYHVKPSDPLSLRTLVKSIHDYWMICEVPDPSGSASPFNPEIGFKLGHQRSQSEA